MSTTVDEGKDEVKRFRATKEEEDEPSHQFSEDKRDVAFETELETRTSVPSTSAAPDGTPIGAKHGAFSRPVASGGFGAFAPSSPSSSLYGPLNTFWHLQAANGLNSLQQAQHFYQQYATGQTYGFPMAPGSSPLFFPSPASGGGKMPGTPTSLASTSMSNGLPPPAHSANGFTALTPLTDPKTESPTFATPLYFPPTAGLSPSFADLGFYQRTFLSPMMGHSPAALSPIHSPAAGVQLMNHHQHQQQQAMKQHMEMMHKNGGMVPLAASMHPMHMFRLAASTNPLTSINQMRLSGMPTPITSMATSLAAQTSNGHHKADGRNGHSSRAQRHAEKQKKENHIKKPLNAFMWFMKENRPKLMEEQGYKERQSAELNKELGRRWHNLAQEEQQKYYAMARDERQKHMQKYPGWSARDNYAINKKKKRKRDKSVDNAEMKKCRARFGLDNQMQWCKHCKRKKRCLWYRESDGKNTPGTPEEQSPPAQVSSTTHGSPGGGGGDMKHHLQQQQLSSHHPGNGFYFPPGGTNSDLIGGKSTGHGHQTAAASPSSSTGHVSSTNNHRVIRPGSGSEPTGSNPSESDMDGVSDDDDDQSDDDDDDDGDTTLVDGIDQSEAAAALRSSLGCK